MEGRGGAGGKMRHGGRSGFGVLPALVFPLPFHASVALRWWRGLRLAVQEKGAVW